MKTARFFCENCGRAVPFNAEMCSNCGKKFDAVKCPVCTYTGMPGEFLQGCPQCGYLSSGEEPAVGARGVRQAEGSAGGRVRDEELFRERPDRHGFPTWAYTTLLILLVGVLVAMATFLLM